MSGLAQELIDVSTDTTERADSPENDESDTLVPALPTTLEDALAQLRTARAQLHILSKQQHEAGGGGHAGFVAATQGFARLDDDDLSGGHGGPGSKMGIEEYFETPMWKLLQQRLPWLLTLLVLQSFSALILHASDSMLKQHLIIAYFVPMVVGTGGNAGNQPGVMVTRALAFHDAETAFPMKKLLAKEAVIALVTGLAVSVVAFLRVWVEFPHSALSAFALGLAMFMVVVIAIVLGVVFSWAIHKCKLDPSAGSAPLLTTVSDLVGIALLTMVGYLILGT